MDEFVEIPITIRVNPLLGMNGEVYLECADGGKWEIESIADFEDSFGVEFPNKTFSPHNFRKNYVLLRNGDVEVVDKEAKGSTYILDLEAAITCFSNVAHSFYIPVRLDGRASVIAVTPFEGLQVAEHFDMDILVDGKTYTVIRLGDENETVSREA